MLLPARPDEPITAPPSGEGPIARIGKIAGAVFLFKLIYLSLVACAIWGWADLDTGSFNSLMRQWPLNGAPTFGSHFAAWDGAHYLFLSEQGYVAGTSSCAFYPLWPLWIRWLAPLAGGDLLWSGLLWSNVFSGIGFALFYRVVAVRYGHRIGILSLVFLLAFPGSLFFQFIYSESLFFLLLMVLWWSLQGNRWGWIVLSGFLLPLTRAVGLLAMLPILWHLITRRPIFTWMPKFARRLSADGTVIKTEASWHNAPAWLLAGVPLLGFATYLGLMHAWTGNSLEGLQAQRFWGNVHSASNALNPIKTAAALFNPTTVHEFTGSVVDRTCFIFMLYCLPLCLKLDRSFAVWIYMLGVFPAMSGTFTSFTRYASTVFPMFVALGVLLAAREHTRWRNVLLAVFLAGHLILLWRFVNWRWAG